MKNGRLKMLALLLAAVFAVMIFSGFTFAGEAGMDEEFHLKETAVDENDPEYALSFYETEYYNYRVLRNIPTAFESAQWDTYVTKGGLMETIDPANITEEDVAKVQAAYEARQQLVQIASAEDCMWYIWGENIPMAEAADSLEFTNADEDNEDFIPYLVPYLLEDQSQVKSNLIVVAGGGYGSRNNNGEGYPIAKAFNQRGFNAFVLQRRVAPYSAEDVWMDMQRSIRYLRHYGEALGIGGLDNISAAGFSGGSATILGTIVNLYGDVQPTIYDETYVPDEVDAENSDLDVAFLIYGPNWYPTHDDEYVGFIGDNENLPAMYIACGEDDATGAPLDCLTLYASVLDKTVAELHIFANVGHGFGVGLYGTNSDSWIPMADVFVDVAKHKEVMEAGGIPENYTQKQLSYIDFPFGTTEVEAYANDDATQFMVRFNVFGDDQVLEGILDNGTARVVSDATGFFSNDIQLIADSLDPNGWEPIEE